MNTSIAAWAIRNNVSNAALEELRAIFWMPPVGSWEDSSMSEAGVQNRVRLEAARKGLKLWRNNVGVLMDSRLVPVRFGLANDSKKLNETIKSGDLIGWRPVLITTQMLGSRIAQFVSRECKESTWKYTGTGREPAQLRWAEAVAADGGDAGFCTGEGTL